MDDGSQNAQGLPAADTEVAPGPAEDTPASEAPPREPPALETALIWLAQVKPAIVLALLRDPEFALVSMTAFAGFRVNASGYANPLVRRRLAQDAVRNEKFADKLRALAEAASSGIETARPPFADVERDQGQGAVDNPQDTTPEPSYGHQPPPPQQAEAGPGAAARLAALKAERDRRRRERDEARQSLAASDAARLDAERRRLQAETERDEAGQQAQKQAQRIARLERQVAKLQVEQASLLRSLRHREETPAGAGGAGSASRLSPAFLPQTTDLQPNPWQAAVTHLLDKRRYDLALALAEDVLRADPDNPEALDIAAQGHGAQGNTREAIALLRRRLAVTLARGARGEAGEVLLRLLLLTPTDTERDLRVFLSGLRADDTPAVEQARALLTRLRGIGPEAHPSVAAAVARLAPAALAEALLPPPGRIGPDDPLPLGIAGNVSARQIVEAVNTGHVDLVEAVRAALVRLERTDAATLERVRLALERAAGDDPSALTPLLGNGGRGPVVVDGSNAAWFDQEALASGRPRLRSLRGLRRALRARGYFPVLLYADAPLPYTIDEPDALRDMAAQGELTLVDGGVDADEVLLREAKRLSARLITNDYMTDWDPNNDVPKIRFTVSLNGEAYLLNE